VLEVAPELVIQFSVYNNHALGSIVKHTVIFSELFLSHDIYTSLQMLPLEDNLLVLSSLVLHSKKVGTCIPEKYL
jgi:hypothetical protein